jgi:hypothetical protein
MSFEKVKLKRIPAEQVARKEKRKVKGSKEPERARERGSSKEPEGCSKKNMPGMPANS